MEDPDLDAYEDEPIDSPTEDYSTDSTSEDDTANVILDPHNEDVRQMLDETNDTTTQIENEEGPRIEGGESNDNESVSAISNEGQNSNYIGDIVEPDSKNVIDSKISTPDCRKECEYNSGKTWQSADYGYSG